MNAPSERIVRDVKVLVTDVEELLKATATQSGERIAAARARTQVALAEAGNAVAQHARQATEATDRYVHDNPWQALGISAGVSAGIGLLLGLLLSRR